MRSRRSQKLSHTQTSVPCGTLNEAGPWIGSSFNELHWYLIINQPFFLFIQEILDLIFCHNINEAGPWTGSSLVFNLKPVFL